LLGVAKLGDIDASLVRKVGASWAT
jgi:hypothetical protein